MSIDPAHQRPEFQQVEQPETAPPDNLSSSSELAGSEAASLSSTDPEPPKLAGPSLVNTPTHRVSTSSVKPESSATSKSLPAMSTQPQFIRDYAIEKTLSKSARSEVFLSSNRKGKKFVLKKISKLANGQELIKNEIESGRLLHHPGIAKFYEHFEDEEYSYLVLQYIRGEDLFQFLSKHSFEQPLKEKDAKKIMRQLVSAVLYCHHLGYAHHDLKLENVILTDEKKAVVKLIDFGLCERLGYLSTPSSPSMERIYQPVGYPFPARLSSSFCGSHDYVPPEILKRTPYCGFKGDCWSLGTLLYIMLYGELPFCFQVRSRAVVKGKLHPKVDFADHRNPNISADAKSLIEAMLCENPANRISLPEVARHKWFAKEKKTGTFSFLRNLMSSHVPAPFSLPPNHHSERVVNSHPQSM